ncbi:MAG: globin [Gammaproteobacteria bacterium]|nr:MAG: globin [Gammaproteobacteria bacterium]
MTTDYGKGDATYQALGGFEGISALVNTFYDIMGSDAQFQRIDSMHSEPETIKRDKLIYFLCSWTGGPENYQAHTDKTSMPGAHAHLTIGEEERDMWLQCMKQAVSRQDYPLELQIYLLKALAQPAEIIRRLCQQMKKQPNEGAP